MTIALESIAGSLKELSNDYKGQIREQKRLIAESEREAQNSPKKIEEIFEIAQKFMGGKHGN